MLWDGERRTKQRTRRSRDDVQAAILQLLVSEPRTLNQLVRRGNFNRRFAVKYIERLQERGLLSLTAEGRFRKYGVTPKGTRWLERYNELRSE